MSLESDVAFLLALFTKRPLRETLLGKRLSNLNLKDILFVYIFDKTATMKNLSLKMDDNVFIETEKITAKISRNRNRYINEAVQFYNLLQKRRIISRQLQKESKIVQEESMKVLAEFEKLQDED